MDQRALFCSAGAAPRSTGTLAPRPMHDPYSPPRSDVSRPSDPGYTGLGRASVTTLSMSSVALGLTWFVFPTILRQVFAPNSTFLAYRPGAPGLIADLVLDAITYFICAYVAARMNRTRPQLVAMGIGAVGWLMYFWEVGGVGGIRFSEYPLWYELTPIHIVPAWVAGHVVSRTRR